VPVTPVTTHRKETGVILLEHDLISLTESIWTSVFDAEATPVPASYAKEHLDGATMTAAVNITGGWEGSVSFTFPDALCHRIAQDMFGLSEDELTIDEVYDAIGELANIAGGNVKGMIEAPCQLSLPMVTQGVHYTQTVPGGRVECECGFVSGDGVFHVVIWARA
jgi:chemotaxis protein CheX